MTASPEEPMDAASVMLLVWERFVARVSPEWVAQWGPVADAARRCARTLGELVRCWVALGGQGVEDEALLAELTAEAREFWESFPEIARIFDGVDQLDQALVEVFTQGPGRERLGVVLDAAELRADALLARGVDLALSADATEKIGAVVDRFDEIERALTFLIERFLVPLLLKLRMDPALHDPPRSKDAT